MIPNALATKLQNSSGINAEMLGRPWHFSSVVSVALMNQGDPDKVARELSCRSLGWQDPLVER
jgi:hypothetical protein